MKVEELTSVFQVADPDVSPREQDVTPMVVFSWRETEHKLDRIWPEIIMATCCIGSIIMMTVRQYRVRSEAAKARAELEIDGYIKSHHQADAESWEALANMAERHAAAMASFKV